MQQAVGVEGVPGAEVVESEVDSCVCAGIDDPGDARPSLCLRDAVLPSDAFGIAAVALGWRVRVELVRPPHDLDRVALREPIECLLEVALAYVAPGTHDVRPDLDLHRRKSTSLRSRILPRRC